MDRPLRIYIAASSREMPRVDAALAALDALGADRAVITYRWIDDMRKAGKSDIDLTLGEAQVARENCIEGVRSCDVFWLLYPIEPTRGAWVELGFAACMQEMLPTHAFRVIVTHEKAIVAGAPPGSGACIFSRPPTGVPFWEEYESDDVGSIRIRMLLEAMEGPS
jgi:hypothetical protein